MVMGNLKNSCVYNFTILVKLQKSDAREIYRYVFYGSCLDVENVSQFK